MKTSLIAVLPLLVFAVGCGATLTRSSAEPPQPFQTNVLDEAQKNEAYRHVLFTGARSQLALMTIPPGGDIGLEAHAQVEQLIFIASGRGQAIMDGAVTEVGAGDVVIATRSAHHNVVNTGREPLRIYTVYAPANHLDGRLQAAKADAEKDQADSAFGAAVR
jgi:mannose-6-phosphate isomerase-like protein (cupin superfamily)